MQNKDIFSTFIVPHLYSRMVLLFSGVGVPLRGTSCQAPYLDKGLLFQKQERKLKYMSECKVHNRTYWAKSKEKFLLRLTSLFTILL